MLTRGLHAMLLRVVDLTLGLNATLVTSVNANAASTWTAEMPARFEGWSLGDIAGLCGAWLLPDISDDEYEPAAPQPPPTIPSDFDSRAQWPKCDATIAHVRDQTDCGSCWAFASTETFNDRRCISTGDTTLLSVQDTSSCCSGSTCDHSNGCVGGSIAGAWAWFVATGAVTGGDYSKTENSTASAGCRPWVYPTCTSNQTHHPDEPLCPKGEYTMYACEESCSNTAYTANAYAADKVRANSTFRIKPYPDSMVQSNMMAHGPVSTLITVFEDFVTYKSGVYKHVSGWQLGSHAVEVIGWGDDPSAGKYWWVKNSWGSGWGLNGFVKVGHGEIGIENSWTTGYVGSF